MNNNTSFRPFGCFRGYFSYYDEANLLSASILFNKDQFPISDEVGLTLASIPGVSSYDEAYWLAAALPSEVVVALNLVINESQFTPYVDRRDGGFVGIVRGDIPFENGVAPISFTKREVRDDADMALRDAKEYETALKNFWSEAAKR